MPTILDQIVVSKRAELAAAKTQQSSKALMAALEKHLSEEKHRRPVGCFHQSLRDTDYIRIIAEVKRQSPSAGAIQSGADAATVATSYTTHGAACISVLTDGPHFGGSLEDLRAVRAAVQTPLLRKDFILESYQVMQAKLAGADAVLLIAEILDDTELINLLRYISLWDMDALVECYEASNVQRVLDAGATLVGINNRNLHNFEVKLEHTLELATQVPANITLVSESGIRTRADVEKLASAGIKAILVGETLMKAASLESTMRELGTVTAKRRKAV